MMMMIMAVVVVVVVVVVMMMMIIGLIHHCHILSHATLARLKSGDAVCKRGILFCMYLLADISYIIYGLFMCVLCVLVHSVFTTLDLESQRFLCFYPCDA